MLLKGSGMRDLGRRGDGALSEGTSWVRGPCLRCHIYLGTFEMRDSKGINLAFNEIYEALAGAIGNGFQIISVY